MTTYTNLYNITTIYFFFFFMDRRYLYSPADSGEFRKFGTLPLVHHSPLYTQSSPFGFAIPLIYIYCIYTLALLPTSLMHSSSIRIYGRYCVYIHTLTYRAGASTLSHCHKFRLLRDWSNNSVTLSLSVYTAMTSIDLTIASSCTIRFQILP